MNRPLRRFLGIIVFFLLIIIPTCQASSFGLENGDVLIYEVRENSQMSYSRYKIVAINSQNITAEKDVFLFATQEFTNITVVVENLVYSHEYLKTLSDNEVSSRNYGGRTVNCIEITLVNSSSIQIIDIESGVVCEETFSRINSSDFKKLISWDDLDIISLYESYQNHFFWGYFISIVGFLSLTGVLITIVLMRRTNGKLSHD